MEHIFELFPPSFVLKIAQYNYPFSNSTASFIMPHTLTYGTESAANKAIGGVPTIHYFDFQSRGRGQAVRLMLIVRTRIFHLPLTDCLSRMLVQHTKTSATLLTNGHSTSAVAQLRKWIPLATFRLSRCQTERSSLRAMPFWTLG